jgi:Winged helix DNA-binding domain
MAIEVSARELLRLREFTQRISPAATGTVTETVRHLLAIQAQDFANALWALGVRTRGSTRSDVLAPLTGGEVVRTLPMRGTLHFVASEDLRWMLALTSARTLQGAKTRFENLGLDPATLERSASIVGKELAGGSLSRDEFMKLLAGNGISTEGQRGYHVIFYLTQLSLVCWGPPSGTQQALVLVDDWIPAQALPTRDAALAQFALRFFASHGPATERDFAWWTKLTLADVRAAMAACAGELSELTHNENSYWIASSELERASTAKAGTGVHALPGFDEYLLGYQDRSLPLPTEHAERIVPGNNGIFLPMITARGRIVGTWRRTPKSTPSHIEAEHFESATDAEHASFARAARAYARFAQN